MSDEKKDPQKNEKVDEELSDLLDSMIIFTLCMFWNHNNILLGALEDFSKEDVVKKENDTETQVATSDPAAINLPEWSNDFIQQATSQFEENFANLLVGMDANAQITPEFIQQKFQQMAGVYIKKL